MVQQQLASKTIVREEGPQTRRIVRLPSGITGFVGITEKGPVGVATKITSPDAYERIFGSFVVGSDVTHFVKGFFAGGGTECWVVRVVHYTDVTNPATAASATALYNIPTASLAASGGTVLGSVVGPFNLEPGDTLVGSVGGGGNQTATFNAAAAARTSGAETFALVNGQDLTLTVNGGALQTIAFLTGEFVDIANATAEEVAAVINAKATGVQATVTGGGTTVTITTDRRGSSAELNITGGTANGALGFTTGAQAGTGDVADIDSVTVAEIKTLVEAAWTNNSGVVVTNDGGRVRITSVATGPASSVLVVASSTADDELGLDNATHSGSAGGAVNTLRASGKYPGTYAHVTVTIAAATSGEAARFNLAVVRNGIQVESWPNLTMDDADARFVETIMNADEVGSSILTMLDLDAAVAAPNDRPANGSYVLAGGDDGVSAIADADYVGAASGVNKTGIRCLDLVSKLRVLSVNRATSVVHNAMVDYCDDTRNGSVFPVLDCPANMTADQIVTYVETTASLLDLSEFGAIYWPRIKIPNPDKTLYGNDALITIPPSGDIIGCYCGTDSARDGGVYDEPAGIERGVIRRARGLETEEVMEETRRDIVYPKNINPIVMGPKGAVLDGTRCLLTTGNFGTIAQRRGVITIEQSIKEALEFVRHTGNDVKLRGEADRATRQFLVEQTKLRAFASENPDEAFFVDTDVEGKTINGPVVRRARQFFQRYGLATREPVDWAIFSVSKDTRALDEELSG